VPAVEIPTEMRAVVLAGRGRDALAVRTVAVPEPGPGELLCRVDAAGICTSVNKLIDQGSEHPLMHGWDPAVHPLVVGDEGAVTVAAVGADLAVRYSPGDRFSVQPAVDLAPIRHLERYRDGARGVGKIAVGYTLPGLLAEYVLIGPEVLAAGCLLPLPGGHGQAPNTLAAAHAAIAEPISCVISSHAHHLHLSQPDPGAPRGATSGLRPGGVVVIVGAGPMGGMHVDVAIAARPRGIVVTTRRTERLRWVRETFGRRAAEAGIRLETVTAGEGDLEAVVARLTEGHGADDVIVTVADRTVVEAAQRLLARFGVLDLFAGLPPGQELVAVDGRLVHYREVNLTGSSGGGPWDLAEALRFMVAGRIDAGVHLGHVGDLEHAPQLFDMAREGRVEGKAVVYPHRRSDQILTVSRWDAADEAAYLADS
jgi:threonine dehydrogenase-like Zn-dependent dehydrogenase